MANDYRISAHQRGAGNIAICCREDMDVAAGFPSVQIIELPVPAPDLAGATLIVSGSGLRLRDILDSPTANLACIVVEPAGETGRIFTSPDCPFKRVTSEFDFHLAVHHDQMRSREVSLHAIVHAQPLSE